VGLPQAVVNVNKRKLGPTDEQSLIYFKRPLFTGFTKCGVPGLSMGCLSETEISCPNIVSKNIYVKVPYLMNNICIEVEGSLNLVHRSTSEGKIGSVIVMRVPNINQLFTT
jgi:hypothetical protein